MSRVAFIQNLKFEYLGIMYLSAVLKEKGHEVRIFIGNNPEAVANDVKKYAPQLAGFSCITGNHPFSLKAASLIKGETDSLTVFGGPHPTFFPEIISEPQVDIVCIGEGEFALLELADKLDRREDITTVKNCWFRHSDGSVIKNELRPLIEDLDALPFPDRSVYYRKYSYLNKSHKVFMAGRGCPFKCSYCFNDSWQKLYSGKGRHIRYRSVGNVLEEIKCVYREYRMQTVYMADDTFILNKDWAGEFLERYAREIKLPLLCLVRADLLDDEIVSKLKAANCQRVFFGIESGSERLRNLILDKHVSDKCIMDAARMLKANGIKFRTYNMLGIPEETLEDAFKTVQINIDIKTDYPWCSILQPYPKTALSEYAKSKGLLSDKALSSYFFKESVLKMPGIREMCNLQKMFYWVVKFPFLKPLVRKLIKLPPNPVFDALFLLGYAYSYSKSERLRMSEVVSIAWQNISSFIFGG